jgi:carbonic anhydrase
VPYASSTKWLASHARAPPVQNVINSSFDPNLSIPDMMASARRAIFMLLLVAATAGIAPPVTGDATPTAADALARLKNGNATFVASPEAAPPIDRARRSALVDGQSPFAAVLSCADSRVPPEIVFHSGLGDLFVVRSAGHVTDRSVLASLEYAAEHLRVPLVVVMGHESCGAVRAATDTPASTSHGPNLDYMLKAIRPATSATRASDGSPRLRAAILRHVEDTINDVIEGSAALRHLGETGTITFVGAYYELSTGRAYFSEPAMVPPSVPHAPRPPVAASPGHPR